LVREKDSNLSKGYCFCEYSDPAITDTAIKGLNGVEIGDKVLTLRRAQPKANGSAPSSPPRNDDYPPVSSLPPGPPVPSNPMHNQTPSRVLILLQMITEENLISDSEYKEIYDDIENEVKKYGDVRSIVIPRPRKGEKPGTGSGKVFIEFGSEEQATRAKRDLEGRQFDNRTVLAQYLPEENFLARDFS